MLPPLSQEVKFFSKKPFTLLTKNPASGVICISKIIQQGGSLTLTSRSCGKPSCKRCQKGAKHPIYFFGYSIKGKKKILSIPAKSHQQVQKLINKWYHHKDLIEELTDINVELIRKGQFKE
jgi:hypothetical protein